MMTSVFAQAGDQSVSMAEEKTSGASGGDFTEDLDGFRPPESGYSEDLHVTDDRLNMFG